MADSRRSSMFRRQCRDFKLKICRYVIYLLWVVNFIFTIVDIYVYYIRLTEHMGCWMCLFRTYMFIAMFLSIAIIPLLIVALPLVVSELSGGLRIYVTIFFLATWLQMMLTILLSQKYQAITDVLRLWMNNKSLEFFEVHSKCCGLIGPDDYMLLEKMIPLSCYKDRSGSPEDLYKAGCSTRSVKPPIVPIIQVISVLIQYGLVLVLVVYLVILKRSQIRRRTLWSVRPTAVYSDESDISAD
ncbi:protein late bloomer isoform X2 [Drosophila elegans]|uniref:protein late bloomer isoform X2 n=1 Tax=Drosophila elegans TaxID=30023 RepID=UPI0007E5FC76|nr:protein late bloomer isoform X2 [Drosophila elegans]